jgi:hypothetical protein
VRSSRGITAGKCDSGGGLPWSSTRCHSTSDFDRKRSSQRGHWWIGMSNSFRRFASSIEHPGYEGAIAVVCTRDGDSHRQRAKRGEYQQGVPTAPRGCQNRPSQSRRGVHQCPYRLHVIDTPASPRRGSLSLMRRSGTHHRVPSGKERHEHSGHEQRGASRNPGRHPRRGAHAIPIGDVGTRLRHCRGAARWLSPPPSVGRRRPP